jgi:RecA-family ATPase
MEKIDQTQKTEEWHKVKMQEAFIALLFSPEIAELLPNLDLKIFDNPTHQKILEIAAAFYKNYKRTPDVVELKTEFLKKWEKHDFLFDEVMASVAETVGNMESLDYAKDELLEIFKFNVGKEALIKAAENLQKGKPTEEVRSKLLADFDKIKIQKKHKLRNPVDAMEEEEEEEEIIVKNWADKLTVSLIAGETKVGKSLLCIQLGMCVALGKDFLEFYVPEARRVLYIQQEIKEKDIKKRWRNLRNILTAEEKIKLAENFKYETTTGSPLKLTEPKDKAEIFGIVEDAKPDLLILDHLRTFHNEKENDSGRMSIVFDHIQELINTFNTAILLVHHFGKEGNFERSSIDRVRGSTVITDRPDFIITVQRLNKKYKRNTIMLPQLYENYAELSFENRSWAKPADMLIERDEGTLLYRESNLYAQLGIKLTPEDVRELVEAAGGEVLQKEVLEMLLERVSRDTAYKNIFAAVEKGYITRQKLPEKGNPFVLRLVEGKQ